MFRDDVNDPTGTMLRYADTLTNTADVLTPANAVEVAEIVREIANSLRKTVHDDTGAMNEVADALMTTADLLGQMERGKSP